MAEMNVESPGGRGVDTLDMRKQRQRVAALQGGDDILHLQFATMMKMNPRTQEKAPVGRGDLLPMVSNIGLQFPIFLIYPGESAKNLPGDMGFRAAQRAAGQQIFHRPVVEHAQDMPTLAKAAA
ncbi:MAG: hypothetical protein E6921_21795 [Klebsiella michiganensis]|nr:hypothetical protein [Klebsiella michiganensis]